MNILLAWELGGGIGHVAALSPIGKHLQDKGHTISYALRSPELADTFDLYHASAIYPAPIMGIITQQNQAAYDCAHMLLIRGYTVVGRLEHYIRQWLHLFHQCQADIVITDHSPAARIAAHIANIPSHAIGNGFAVPPVTAPLALLNKMQTPDANLQKNIEQQLNTAVNLVLNKFSCASVERSIEVFFGGPTYLTTLPELDNYFARPNTQYYGVTASETKGISPRWIDNQPHKIFIYLHAHANGVNTLLTALRALNVEIIIYLSGEVSPQTLGLCTSNITLAQQPITLTELAPECNLVICHGGNTVATALHQGIPVLCCPQHIEQRMTGLRVKEQHLGNILELHANTEDMKKTVKNTLDNQAIYQQAANFSEKYQDINKNTSAVIAEAILEHYQLQNN